MSRPRFVALAAAAVLVTGSFAAAQSDDVTITLPRPVAQVLLQELEEALGTTTTTGGTTTTVGETTTTVGATTTTVGVTTTTLPATTTTISPPPTTTTTVTSPPGACSGVQVAAGSNLVTVANSQTAGATFCLAAGVFQVTASIPFQSGDRWVGTLAGTGERLSILTGANSTKYLVQDTSNNVLLQNVVVEKFANETQQGVNRGAQTAWTFDNVEVRENLGHGIHTHDNSRVTNSFIHHNQQMGLGGNGDNVLIEGNEIAYNNYQAKNVPGFEAGGTKWIHTVNLTVRNNHSHHNCGNGLWTDGSNTNTLYEGNVAEDNWAAGIFSEINPGPTVIRNNIVRRNAFGQAGGVCTAAGGGGAGGIRVNDSRNVEVYGNIVEGNDGGIFSIDADRGAANPNLTGLYVHDNTVVWSVGSQGIMDTAPGEADPFSAAANNRYRDNDYTFTGGGAPFQWAGAKTWAQWNGVGQDLGGSFD